MIGSAEYIWLDGAKPTQQPRSKTRVVSFDDPSQVRTEQFPEWSYDGSSTYQASGSSSDLILKPVRHITDPIRGEGNFLVLCEVFLPDGRPHSTNTRAQLRDVLEAGGDAEDPWIGYEQEYTLFSGKNHPLGWPENGYPEPQGPFYCGVGSDHIFGRDLVEQHLQLCIRAGICIYGVNAEVMPGQWEFQIGYRGLKGEQADALTMADHLTLARWLLSRLGEDYDVRVSYANKPIKGDWNGAGCHANFSTNSMRDPTKGQETITKAVAALETKHLDHVLSYGHGLEERLTGLHETCSMNEFRWGVSDRGSSIRIPQQVHENGYGYIEDRRPGANCCPYVVASKLIGTICGIESENASSPTGHRNTLRA